MFKSRDGEVYDNLVGGSFLVEFEDISFIPFDKAVSKLLVATDES